jgi:hypothetical protein
VVALGSLLAGGHIAILIAKLGRTTVSGAAVGRPGRPLGAEFRPDRDGVAPAERSGSPNWGSAHPRGYLLAASLPVWVRPSRNPLAAPLTIRRIVVDKRSLRMPAVRAGSGDSPRHGDVIGQGTRATRIM